jgi:hypothetical protein
MTKPEKPDENEQLPQTSTTPRRRKPYTKPSFVREQLFETMALACGKVSSTIAQCKLNRKNS